MSGFILMIDSSEYEVSRSEKDLELTFSHAPLSVWFSGEREEAVSLGRVFNKVPARGLVDDLRARSTIYAASRKEKSKIIVFV